MSRNIVARQLIAWGLVPAGGLVFDAQAGLGMTVNAQVAGVCTVTLLGISFLSIPLMVNSWTRGSTPSTIGSVVGAPTFVVSTMTGVQVLTNLPFGFEVIRSMSTFGATLG